MLWSFVLRRIPAPRPYRSRTPIKRHTFRPGVELLEDRLAPAGIVTNLNDTGPGSLRAALTGGGAVTFQAGLAGTISLASTLTLAADTTLTGPGAGVINVSGGGTVRDFTVNAGVTASISGLTISGGNGNTANGGGILNQGSLTVSDSVISGNQATGGNHFGGGILNAAGASLAMLRSTLSANSGFYGGGLLNYATATLTSCTISGNGVAHANGFSGGGGLLNEPAGTLTMYGCTVSGNTAGSVALASGGAGAGLSNYGTAGLTNCTISGNSISSGDGAYGGGIANVGTLTLTSSSITGNTITSTVSRTYGGGIDNFGTLTAASCTFANNAATSTYPLAPYGYGGAIANAYNVGQNHTITISDSTFSNNSAYVGGAIDNFGIVSISRSGLFGNQAGSNGGALENRIGATMSVVNSTLAQNQALGSGAAFRNLGTLTVLDSTLSGNTAVTNGGGLSQNPGVGTATLGNTIVAGNSAPLGPDIYAPAGRPVTANSSLIGNTGGATITGGGNLTNVNPLLGPLQNNGGPTLTMALLPGSPAIDAGSNALVGGSATDQRGTGFNRVINGTVDIGAYEFQPAATATTLVSSLNPSIITQSVTFTATVAGTAPGSNVPQGTVTFLDGGTPLATVALVNGSASFSTSALSIGPHTITAQYSGFTQGNYTFTASQATLAQQVQPRPIAAPIIAVGADAGGSPEVRVYDAFTRVLKFAFFAFPQSFTGGVRVAVGDVNGDGTPDIVCGAGPGGGPEVSVFDGKTGRPLAGTLGAFYGLKPSSFTGGVYVAVGDINGDGFADIIVGADAGGGPQVNVYSGKDGSLLESFNALAPGFTGGVRVAAGDVNSDGKADIITGAGAGALPQVTVYDGITLAVLQSFYAFPTFFTGGVYVAAGDLTGIGRAQIIVGAGPGAGPQVNIYDGSGARLASFFATNPSVTDVVTEDANVHAGVRVGVVAAGARSLVLTAPGPGPQPLVEVSSVAAQALVDSFFAFDPTFRGGVFVGGWFPKRHQPPGCSFASGVRRKKTPGPPGCFGSMS